jgi:hypothetical protein
MELQVAYQPRLQRMPTSLSPAEEESEVYWMP